MTGPDASDRPGVRVARVRAEDLGAVGRLLCAARGETGRARGGRVLLEQGHGPPRPEQLPGIASDPDAALFAAFADGGVVGVAIAACGTGPSPLGRVLACYVEPGQRSRGFGTALLREAVSWCAAAGCVGVDVDALPGDRATKSLLEKGGFTARKLVMHRPLGDETAG